MSIQNLPELVELTDTDYLDSLEPGSYHLESGVVILVEPDGSRKWQYEDAIFRTEISCSWTDSSNRFFIDGGAVSPKDYLKFVYRLRSKC